jgi:pimeloyl-ACP methyl ester carboxylesterase
MFDFDDEALDQLPTEPAEPFQDPVLVCFYSGGFFHADGRKLLNDVLEAAALKGIGDTLVLGFPDYYGITGDGYDPWSTYVDRLVEELDEEYEGRPVLIFGHSRGAGAAMSLATRLGKRVLKVYCTASGGILPGKPTGWETLSKGFKAGGDKELITWFSSLQPGNLVLAQTAALPPEKIPDALAQSKFLNDMVTLMRLQYRDATYPRMQGDSPDIDVLDVPLVYYGPVEDPGSDIKVVGAGWKLMSRVSVELIEVSGGHMDCLHKPATMLEKMTEDMAKFVPKGERTL